VRVRDVATPNALFRQELSRIGMLLMAEATRHLPTHAVRVTTPLTETDGRALTSQPVVIPVLRAGLGFVQAAQEGCCRTPTSASSVCRGTRRTFQPKPYVNKLPESLAGRQCNRARPDARDGRIARAHVRAPLRARAQRGRSSSSVCSPAPEGIRLLEEAGLDIALYTAAIRRAAERERVHRARPRRRRRSPVRLAWMSATFDDVADLVRRRRTNLAMDLDRPVPEQLVELLAELVRWAPNHKRTWPWETAWVTEDGRRRLGEVAAFDDGSTRRRPREGREDADEVPPRARHRRGGVRSGRHRAPYSREP
jgi:uracil phosphoribosyltransferase